MNIAKNTVVTLDFVIRYDKGDDIKEISDKILYLHGNHDNIFPKVQQELSGKTIGDEISITLEPNDHFGERHEEFVHKIPRTELPNDIEVDMTLEAKNSETGETILVLITDLDENTATLDANHPWAGRTLNFYAKVTDIRAATEEEIAHKHVHEEDDTH